MKKEIPDYKYFTKQSLLEANNEALRTNRNRALDSTKLLELSDTDKFPVIFTMPHNDVELRLGVLLYGEGGKGYLDVPFETYDSLPNISEIVQLNS